MFATDDYLYVLKDGHLVKLDGSDNVIWEKPVIGGDIFVNDNRVYVGGAIKENSSGSSDSIVTAFETDGTQLWSSRRESTKGDQIYDVCATDEGVYIVGSGTKGWNFRFMTKFSLTGEQLWDKKLVDTDNGSFRSLYSINGEIFAAGGYGDSPNSDVITAIIGKDGIIQWSNRYGFALEEDYAYSIHSDNSRVYVVGTVDGYYPPFRRGLILIYEK